MFNKSLRLWLGVFLMLKSQLANSQEVIADSSHHKDFVISYAIQLDTDRKKTSVGDAYDGGSKTIFISDNKVRIRLVSLMRIESLFFFSDSTGISIYQLKESGKKTTRRELKDEEWKALNTKYDSARYELNSGGGKKILGYACKKATVHLKDGRTITCFYTEQLPALPFIYEPAFAGLPGLVLEYTYSYKSGGATYTAVSIKTDRVSPGIFLVSNQ